MAYVHGLMVVEEEAVEVHSCVASEVQCWSEEEVQFRDAIAYRDVGH